jgi:hypothetical protein
MTHFERRPRRKSLEINAILGVLALSAAIGGCAAPGGSKQIALAANTPSRARASEAAEQRHRQPDYITLAPSRSVPIPGTGPNPSGLGPPEAFPDPYRDPQ